MLFLHSTCSSPVLLDLSESFKITGRAALGDRSLNITALNPELVQKPTTAHASRFFCPTCKETFTVEDVLTPCTTCTKYFPVAQLAVIKDYPGVYCEEDLETAKIALESRIEKVVIGRAKAVISKFVLKSDH